MHCIIKYLDLDGVSLSSTAKFILSNFHENVYPEQIGDLQLETKEAEVCVELLNNNRTFSVEEYTTKEILQVLINFTHPMHSDLFLEEKNKLKNQKKGKESRKVSGFEQALKTVRLKYKENVLTLDRLGILSAIENILSESMYIKPACQILWNIIHHCEIRCKLKRECSKLRQILEDLKHSSDSELSLMANSCLWMLQDQQDKMGKNF